MISKKLLSHSLFSTYKDFFYSEEKDLDDSLKKEIWELAADSSFFTEKEIQKNKQKLTDIEELSKYREFVCHIDGAVDIDYDHPEIKLGKNIRAGCSFIVESNNQTLMENYFPIPVSYYGKDTNSHIAEYQALVSCLRVLSNYHHTPSSIDVILYSDSQVLTKQMDLEIRTRDSAQRVLRAEAQKYVKMFNDVNILHCPREQNQRADTLAKRSIQQKEWVEPEKESFLL